MTFIEQKNGPIGGGLPLTVDLLSGAASDMNARISGIEKQIDVPRLGRFSVRLDDAGDDLLYPRIDVPGPQERSNIEIFLYNKDLPLLEVIKRWGLGEAGMNWNSVEQLKECRLVLAGKLEQGLSNFDAAMGYSCDKHGFFNIEFRETVEQSTGRHRRSRKVSPREHKRSSVPALVPKTRDFLEGARVHVGLADAGHDPKIDVASDMEGKPTGSIGHFPNLILHSEVSS